jgi:hypothetical protein
LAIKVKLMKKIGGDKKMRSLLILVFGFVTAIGILSASVASAQTSTPSPTPSTTPMATSPAGAPNTGR